MKLVGDYCGNTPHNFQSSELSDSLLVAVMEEVEFAMMKKGELKKLAADVGFPSFDLGLSFDSPCDDVVKEVNSEAGPSNSTPQVIFCDL